MNAPPSAAMRAAREIRALLGLSGSHDSEVAAVISRHCSAPADAGMREALEIARCHIAEQIGEATDTLKSNASYSDKKAAQSLIADLNNKMAKITAALAAADAGMCDQDFANLTTLRGWGWDVAVHNDDRIDGKRRTFWLFTHPDGRWIKGEGETDADALYQCYRTASPPPAARP